MTHIDSVESRTRIDSGRHDARMTKRLTRCPAAVASIEAHPMKRELCVCVCACVSVCVSTVAFNTLQSRTCPIPKVLSMQSVSVRPSAILVYLCMTKFIYLFFQSRFRVDLSMRSMQLAPPCLALPETAFFVLSKQSARGRIY